MLVEESSDQISGGFGLRQGTRFEAAMSETGKLNGLSGLKQGLGIELNPYIWKASG